MKIRTRIALQFTLIVASILLLFSAIIYTNTANYRREEFYDRLLNKARTTARFLVNVQEVDEALLRIIDRNTYTGLIGEKVWVFTMEGTLLYASTENRVFPYRKTLLGEIRNRKLVETIDGEVEIVGIIYNDGAVPLIVVASAFDKFGRSKLSNLGNTLLWGLIGGIGLTVLLGFYFAGNSLKPIARINDQVSTITARNLQQRLDEGNRRDEIAQLAINFNSVLSRLQQAFEQQRSFVSHASHELRTPLAALKSEVQLAERYAGDDVALQEIFRNLDNDTDRLISITNSLLFLARSFENISQMTTSPVRMEDIIFMAKEELLAAHANYQVTIQYQNLPPSENYTVIDGNEELLRRVILNLIDNACKYSANKTAEVIIETNDENCTLCVVDTGIGIAPEEQSQIFEPFYRASNATTYSGFGIGLSISQRIVDIHGGTLTVESTPGQGSTFKLVLRHV
jgi:signal transduction histidine kinase